MGNRSAAMLNKSMTANTLHVTPTSVPATSSAHEEIDSGIGNGWEDDDLDLLIVCYRILCYPFG